MLAAAHRDPTGLTGSSHVWAIELDIQTRFLSYAKDSNSFDCFFLLFSE